MKPITVAMRGGLGNQLFCLAAGWSQAHRFHCGLVVDTSLFLLDSERTYLLEGLMHPAKTIKNKNPLLTRLGRTFIEKSFDFDPTINEVTPGTTLNGYFQSPKYFQNIEQEVLEFLFAATAPASSYLRNLTQGAKKTVAIHVRRGDYLSPKNLSVHGVTSDNYFVDAFDRVQQRLGEVSFLVFSDSPNYLPDSVNRIVAGGAYLFGPEVSPFEVIGLISQCDGVVMSNSSLSWWSAWVGSKTSSQFLAIAPRSWFADGRETPDLLLNRWEQL